MSFLIEESCSTVSAFSSVRNAAIAESYDHQCFVDSSPVEFV
jgi:hypothetical protein